MLRTLFLVMVCCGILSITGCPIGTYNDGGSCKDCIVGKYNPFAGATRCRDCTPGSICPAIGMPIGYMCEKGTYAESKGSTICDACPSGTYQPDTGEARCLVCPAGKSGTRSGSTSSEDCEVDPLPFSPAMNDPLYSSGIALAVSVAVGLLYAAVILFMQLKKEAAHKAYLGMVRAGKDKKTLAEVGQMSRSYASFRAALSGLHFGTEVFIIVGLLISAPLSAAGIIIVRLVHVPVTLLVLGATFGSVGSMLESIGLVRNASVLFAQIEDKFVHKIMPLTGFVTFLAFFDSTLLQFLPWRSTIVFKESGGFPTVSVWRWSLAAFIIQSATSIGILSAFLVVIGASVTSPSITLQSKLLFALNMLLSLTGCGHALLTLCIKDRLVRTRENELLSAESAAIAAKRQMGRKASLVRMADTDERDIETARMSAAISFSTTYSHNKGRGSLLDESLTSANPLVDDATRAAAAGGPSNDQDAKLGSSMAAYKETINTLQFENQDLKNETKVLEAENEQLKADVEFHQAEVARYKKQHDALADQTEVSF